MSFNDSNMSSSAFSMNNDKNGNKTEKKYVTDFYDESSKAGDIDLKIVDKIYQAKRADILKELKQLEDRTHPKYVEQLKKLKLVQENQLMKNQEWKVREIEQVEIDYLRATENAYKEFNDRKNELTEKLIAELNEDKKKTIELYNLTSELSLDQFDEKPIMTRKLRKRPNNVEELVPAPQVKLHKQSVVPNIQFMLHDHEIESDIKDIQESAAFKSLMPSTSTAAITTVIKSDTVNSLNIKIPGFLPSSNSSSGSSSPKKCQDIETDGSSTNVDTRIENGKLRFEKIWYHRGQPVFIEGKQIDQFPAVISAIQHETIWVKKTSFDDDKFQISLSQLLKGEMSIKRRAAI